MVGGYALKHVPDELKTPELCLAAVNNDGRAIDLVPRELCTPELCLAAVKSTARDLDWSKVGYQFGPLQHVLKAL